MTLWFISNWGKGQKYNPNSQSLILGLLRKNVWFPQLSKKGWQLKVVNQQHSEARVRISISLRLPLFCLILDKFSAAFVSHQFSSVQFSHSVVSHSLWSHEFQHARPLCPSPAPGVHPNSCPSCRWCHPAISSSVVPFSSCPQSLPASESFPMSQLFAWGGQSTGLSALASFLPKKIQGWSPSEWIGWISLQSKGLSRVFSNTTVQKHQFFSSQSVS